MTFDVAAVRDRFPAMGRVVAGRPAVWLDGPGGSQCPRSVIDAIGAVLSSGVSNLGGPFAASDFAGEIVDDARAAMADFFNAGDPRQIAFGPSMTALTLAAARSLGRQWGPGDEVVVTRLDHDANVSPWLIAAEEAGATVRWVDFNPEDGCALDPVESALSDRTKLLAITHASNAVGTIPDVAAACAAARAVGALTFVDAVHYSQHGIVDVQALDCDFLAASAYKFHGPHVGVLYLGRRVVDAVEPVHIRPAPSSAPGSWERGTAAFELLAGVTAAVDYLASLGSGPSRRPRLVAGIGAAAGHTDGLAAQFVGGLAGLDHVTMFGPGPGQPRTPTFAIEVDGWSAEDVAAALGEQGIFVWAGHYYALEALRRLGRLESGGLTRIGFLHYNTSEEVDRLLASLAGLAS
jgi:cysteine desulfurase family protein (TIGR01976 family)